MKNFSGFVLREHANQLILSLEQLTETDLSDGDITIEVAYSSVNYKDALAVTEHGSVIRNYPMIPGIDLSGTIISSSYPDLQIGDQVLVTGYGLGVTHTGGFAEIARVPHEWVVPLPKGLTLKQAMLLGTAGLTAALAIDALEKMGLAANKEASILITGATGGVGSLSIALLKRLGYKNIVAVSRKKEEETALYQLGATNVLSLEEFLPEKSRPLMKQSYDYGIDTVGGTTATTLIAQLSYGGSVALCGNAGATTLYTTVLPFILRGINLLGIDSVNVPLAYRKQIWQRLATDLAITHEDWVDEQDITALPHIFSALQTGTHRGRTLIKMNDWSL